MNKIEHVMNPYKLSSQQVRALFELLYRLNLLKLSNGLINVQDTEIDPEYGKLIEDMFYSEEFALEDNNE